MTDLRSGSPLLKHSTVGIWSRFVTSDRSLFWVDQLSKSVRIDRIPFNKVIETLKYTKMLQKTPAKTSLNPNTVVISVQSAHLLKVQCSEDSGPQDSVFNRLGIGTARASGWKSISHQKYAESTQLDFTYFLNLFWISRDCFSTKSECQMGVSRWSRIRVPRKTKLRSGNVTTAFERLNYSKTHIDSKTVNDSIT